MTAPTAFPDGYQPPSAVLAAQLGAGVFLQLGAFNSLENAESAHARVSQQLPWLGVPVHIVLENDLFKLRAGPYRGRAQALAAAERVVRVTGARPFTVVR